MKIKNFVAIFLVFTIIFPQLSVFANATDTINELPNYSATLHDAIDGSGNGTGEIGDGATVSLQNQYYYIVDKSLYTGEGEDAVQDVKEGETYTITLPDPLRVYETREDYKMKFEGDVEYKNTIIHITCEIGTYSMVKGENKVNLAFEMGKVTVADNNVGLTENDIKFSWITNFHIAIQCMLDENEINADENGEITILFPQNKTLNLIIEELKPEEPIPPTLTKKVTKSMNSTGFASWEIVYTAPNKAYVDKGENVPVKLVDTLPEGLKFSGNIKISFIKNGQVTDSVYQNTNDTFVYSIDQDVEKITITYDTQLTDEEFYQVWQYGNKTYENVVYAYTSDNKEIKFLTKKASVNTNNIAALLDKEAHDITYHKATDTIPDFYTIDWTIYVNTSGKALTNLTFIDTYADGLFVSPRMLESDENFKKFNLKIEYTTSQSDTKPIIDMRKEDVELKGTGQTINGHEKYEIHIKLDDYINGTDGVKKIDTTKQFKITYSMQVDENFLNSTNPNVIADDFKNTVYGNFKTEKLTSSLTSASVSDKPSYTIDALISLKGTGYDHKTRKIGWSAIINPPKKIGSQPNLTKIVFQDDASNKVGQIGNEYQSFGWTDEMLEQQRQNIENQIKAQFDEKNLANATVDVSFDLVGDKQYLNIVMTGTGQEQIDFQYYTYSMDARYWGGNYNSQYQYPNTVYLLSGEDGTLVDGKPIMGNFSAKATNTMQGKALVKSSTNYDVNSKLLTWTIDLNERCAPLNQTRIVETLSPELELYSCTVDGQEIPIYKQKTEDISKGDYVLYENGKPVIYLDSVYEKHSIQVITKVDINSETFKRKETVNLGNKAALEIFSKVDGDKWIETVNNTASSTIKNDILSKTQVRENNKSTKVDYTVKLNPLGLELLSDDQLHLYIEDTLDDGLSLDNDSVKLYNAKVNISKSDFTYTPNLIADDEVIDANITFDYAVNTLRVELPQTDKAYILKYTAYITRKNVTLSNNIKLVGSSVPQESNQHEANCDIKLDNYSGVTLRPPANLFYSVFVKKTNENKKPLSGATIGLYSKKDETSLLGVGVSGEDGNCIISVKNSLVKNYKTLYIKEITAPDGYLLNGEWFEFTKEQGEISSENSPVATIENQQAINGQKGKLLVYRYDEDTSGPLAGAEFALYSADDMQTPIKTGVTNMRGLLVFDGLKEGATYFLKETKAPEGYLIDDKYKDLTSTGKITTAGTEIQVESSLNPITLTVIKKDGESKIPLAGAEFALYSDADCKMQVGTNVTTNNRGEAEFTGLNANQKYWLKEIKAPEGYKENDKIIEVDFTQIQDNEIEVYNQKDSIISPTETLKIIKCDSEDISKKLAGAEFALYSDADCKMQVGTNVTTNNRGEAEFTGLNANQKYWLKEIKAPEGYKENDKIIEVDFTQIQNNEILVTNQKEDTSINPNPPENPDEGGSSSGGSSGGSSSGGDEGSENPSEPDKEYTLQYECNGGTLYDDENYSPDKLVKLGKIPYRAGYVFTGWYADEQLTQLVKDVTMNENKIIYAGWEKYIPSDMLNTDDHFAYIIGYPDGEVKPTKNITRAEIATIFFRLIQPEIREENLTNKGSFNDVISGMWHNIAISTTQGLGIIKGYEDGSFEPDKPITRAELAAIAVRFDKTNVTYYDSFSDISGHWAEDSIKKAMALGWVRGYPDGTFKPDEPITRAEAMTLINNVLLRLPEYESDLLDGMVVWSDNTPDIWYYLAVQEATNSHNHIERF